MLVVNLTSIIRKELASFFRQWFTLVLVIPAAILIPKKLARFTLGVSKGVRIKKRPLTCEKMGMNTEIQIRIKVSLGLRLHIKIICSPAYSRAISSSSSLRALAYCLFLYGNTLYSSPSGTPSNASSISGWAAR